GVAVARVDRVRVRVDQARGDKPAAQVLHQVNIDDVIDNARDAARQLRGRADPGDTVVNGQDGGVAQDLRPGPEPTDVGQQTDGHWRFLVCREPLRSAPAIMIGHLPCFVEVGVDRTYLVMRATRLPGLATCCAPRPTYRFRYGIAPRGSDTSPTGKCSASRKLLAGTLRTAPGKPAAPAPLYDGVLLQFGGQLRRDARLKQGAVWAVFGASHLARRL